MYVNIGKNFPVIHYNDWALFSQVFVINMGDLLFTKKKDKTKKKERKKVMKKD
jgi:hypothetical protein